MPILRLRATHAVVIAALAVALVGGSLVFTIVAGPAAWGPEPPSPAAMAFGARGAEKVKAAYAEWVKQHNAAGGDRSVTIALGYWKALSSTYTTAGGKAKLNLIDGSMSVTVSDLPAGEWDVWLVDNRPGPRQSIKPEPSDTMIKVGRLAPNGATAMLNAELGPSTFRAFHVDLVVVAAADGDPTTGLLFGSPSVFQRLYTAIRSEKLLRLSDFAAQRGITVKRPWVGMLGASPAEADFDIIINESVAFSNIIAKGADLFLNETFNGNGRTCGTCHSPKANFTIDVNFIAGLRDDDPLFVAEFTPALAFNPFGPKFEVPVLMRGAALIVENVDGTSDLKNKFTMRGTPHTLGLRNSITASTTDGTTMPPNQRTGWSGDGAPGTGTLREFATGAVNQHFTKTLKRRAGIDFRLPTDDELDAMEMFQLSLGRQADLVLPLELKDARASRGQQLFLTNAPAGGSCNVCHFNAGANASFDPRNRNFNTGVENQLDRPAELILRAANIDLTPGVTTNIIPRDGGFGPTPGEGPDGTGFGNGTFNTPSLVEAADTPPFFHDNSVETIEGAVAFYNSTAFKNSPSGPLAAINLQATQVEAIAAFLRVINALDNIREATETASAARSVGSRDVRAVKQLLDQAIKDTQDAMTVLFPRGLHPSAVKSLEHAADSFARAVTGSGSRLSYDRSSLDRGLSHLASARRDIVR